MFFVCNVFDTFPPDMPSGEQITEIQKRIRQDLEDAKLRQLAEDDFCDLARTKQCRQDSGKPRT